jgi:uncharacterized membrane protein YfcA
MMLEHFDALHAVAGLLVGILVGVTGVGGGSLMTPILVLLFGVNPGTAVGTDLLFASMTKVVGSAVHGKRDTIDWRILLRLASAASRRRPPRSSCCTGQAKWASRPTTRS